MHTLTAILDALAPVILVVALGYAMRRVAFLPPGFFKGLNKLTYWVGLPILLFVKIGAASLNLGPVMRLSGILISSILAITAIAVVLAYRLPMAPFSRGAFIQASFRGN